MAFITDQPLPSVVKHVIDTVQVPVISTTHVTTDHNSSIINFTPSEEQVANALSQLLVDGSWNSVVLVTWPGSGNNIRVLRSHNYRMFSCSLGFHIPLMKMRAVNIRSVTISYLLFCRH